MLKITAKSTALKCLKAGTNLGAKSDADIVDGDAKTFELGGKKVRIGQVNTVDLDDVFARQADLESQMQSMMDDNDYDLFLLIATNILNSELQNYWLLVNLLKRLKQPLARSLTKTSG